MKDRHRFFFYHVEHFLDHFFLLIFTEAAALVLISDLHMPSYD